MITEARKDIGEQSRAFGVERAGGGSSGAAHRDDPLREHIDQPKLLGSLQRCGQELAEPVARTGGLQGSVDALPHEPADELRNASRDELSRRRRITQTALVTVERYGVVGDARELENPLRFVLVSAKQME